MRICWPSASRQPCRACSCIVVTRKRPSGENNAPRCEPFQASISGFAVGGGEQGGRAFVRREGEPQPLRGEGEPAHGRAHFQASLAFVGANKGGLPDRPRDRAGGSERNLID